MSGLGGLAVFGFVGEADEFGGDVVEARERGPRGGAELVGVADVEGVGGDEPSGFGVFEEGG